MALDGGLLGGARTRWLAAVVTCGAVLAGCAASRATGPGRGADAVPATATGARGPAVPILLYHHLGPAPPGDEHASLWVAPARFEQQIAALAAAGFHAVTLDAVWRAWHGGPRLPARPVVLTFDDGYADQDGLARPVLRRRGWPGVLNLQLNRVGATGGLSHAALRRLVRAGWEVDDHSTTHPHLTKVDARRLRAEVAGSRAALRRRLGIATRFFCYPYGRSDARVRAAVRAAGFVAATTTEPVAARPDDDPLALPRILVRATTTPRELVAIATAGHE